AVLSLSCGRYRSWRSPLHVRSEAQDRQGRCDGASIPRMIRPLLEGFDPARRPLLFSRGILACSALLEDGAASIFQIWPGAAPGSAICAADSRNQLLQSA